MSFKKNKMQVQKPPMQQMGKPEHILFVSTPMYGGMCTGMYSSAIAQAIGIMQQARIGMYYSFMMNESLITRARNSLAYDFLQSEATHLLFIDADIGFNPNFIPPMVHADKDIICGLYPKKEINWVEVSSAVGRGVPPHELEKYTGAFVVNLVDNKQVTTNIQEPVEIDNGGTGFMLIKRKVFEGLIGKVPTYTNDMYHAVDTERPVKIINEFFTTSIDEESNRLLSEDYHFCKIARKAGFKVWAAPWCNLTHTGTYNFSGALPKVS